jgi:rod shape determining protein RodA
VIFPTAHLLFMVGLIYLISGDMGSALVYVFIFICMMLAAGTAWRWFALGVGGGGAGLFVLYKIGKIPGYMMERFKVIFDHSYDVLGKGWQQTRSLLAIGSGGVFGQGYMQGAQTQSGYSTNLPARHTDLIFSVAAEELGMIGALAILLLLSAIIVRVLIVARQAQSHFFYYVCVGMAAMLIFQTLINVGMCLYVMPVIGITLPFFSYGGSSIVTLFAAMGVVSGIKKRTPNNRYHLRRITAK